MDTINQPQYGVGSTAETNRLLGGNYFNTQTGGATNPKDIIGNPANPIKTGALPGSFVPSNTINAGTLGQVTPFSIPTVAPQTTADGISGRSAALASQDQLAQQAEQEKANAQLKYNEQESQQKGLINRILGVQGSRTQLEEDAGVKALQETRRKASDALIVSQRAQQNELAALEGKGLSDIEKAQAARAIKNKYANSDADLQLTYHLANSDLNAAEDTINEKIRLQLEPLQTEYDLTKGFLDRWGSLLDKADQRAFEAKANRVKTELDSSKDELDKIGAIQLEMAKNGAPASLIARVGNAGSYANAVALGSGYMVDPLDRQIKERTNTATGGVSPTGKPTGKPDYKEAGYATRTVAANQIINDLGSKFVSAGSLLGQFSPNVLKSSERQQYDQAQRNFVNAVLRNESGAAIAPSEFDNAKKQYFPQPGDSAEVIAQKEANRVDAINALIGNAGRAYPGTYITTQSKQQLGPGSAGSTSSGLKFTILP